MKNIFLKNFSVSLVTLLFFILLGVVSIYFIFSDISLIAFYTLYIFSALIYSLLYAIINETHNFSTKYSIIFNGILGVFLLLNIIFSYLGTFITRFHLLFTIFLIIQLIIALRDQNYKKDKILKAFKISLTVLSPFILSIYILGYLFSPSRILSELFLPVYFLFLLIYSFVYSQINRIYDFSGKYTIIFSLVLGIVFLIDGIFSHLYRISFFYYIIILSIATQIILAFYNKYKKNAQH